MIVELSRTSLLQAIKAARRGQWITYYVGFLFEDRWKSRRLAIMANEARAQYDLGEVELVQGKLGPGIYQYFAVKR